MARAIDADALQELCNRRIQDTWNSRTAPVSWAEAYADFKDDIDSMPTITPPNEPEYREYTCPNCHHTWLEDRDASDYPEYCPGCGDPLHKEENEPLTCKGDENGEQ